MFLTVSESVLNDTEPTQKILKAIINNIGEISDLIPNAHHRFYSDHKLSIKPEEEKCIQ